MIFVGRTHIAVHIHDDKTVKVETSSVLQYDHSVKLQLNIHISHNSKYSISNTRENIGKDKDVQLWQEL